MTRVIQLIVLAFAGCVFFLAGCGGKTAGTVDEGPARKAEVNCIGVMSAAFLPEGQVAPVYMPEDKNGRHSVQVMNEILSRELGGKNKIRFVTIDQLGSLNLAGGEDALEIARLVGESIKCEAVLETVVTRFRQRDGGRYSVAAPAAAGFDMRLIALEGGEVLWSARFDESQKPVMENLLEWKKANTRGFVWLTAEELMQEGVAVKLADSPYFASE